MINELAVNRRREFIVALLERMGDQIPEHRKHYFLGQIDALIWVAGDDDE